MEWILDRAAAIGRFALLCIVLLLVLIAFAFYAPYQALRESWRSDIVPAWQRMRRS